MKKYLQEVMANPKYRKAFEEDEIFATLVTAMTYETQSEVKIVHLLCKHLKDLCEKLEVSIGVFEIDTGAPNFKETMEKQLKEELHKYKARFGEAPTVILMGKDIQSALADHIIVSNQHNYMVGRNLFKPEKTLFGITLKDSSDGTITFASSGGAYNAGIGTNYDYHLRYFPNYVYDKQFEGRQEVMAICNGKNYIPEDGLDGLCIADKCENIAICLRHKYYDIHRKIAEAGEAPPTKRRLKMNKLFATAPNDNSCRSFHPEANCPYPLCDNMECDERDNCWLHTDHEVKHGPY